MQSVTPVRHPRPSAVGTDRRRRREALPPRSTAARSAGREGARPRPNECRRIGEEGGSAYLTGGAEIRRRALGEEEEEEGDASD